MKFYGERMPWAYGMRNFLIVSFALALTTTTSRAQDTEVGENLFKMCMNCHAIGVGATNRLGPELNGLDGRKAGGLESFADYSVAIKKSGITWSDGTFMQYIQNPRAKIPGTTMSDPGIVDEKKIAALWAYIKQFEADGKRK